jgi:hypothetical protein
MKMKLSILALMATLVIVNQTGSRGYSYRDVSLPVYEIRYQRVTR